MANDSGERPALRPRPSKLRERSSDEGLGGWLLANWGKYSPVATVVVILVNVIGFKVVSPRDELAALHLEDVRMNRRMDSIALTMPPARVVDSLQKNLVLVTAFTVGLMKDRCLDMTPQRAYNVEIPCDSLLRRYGVRPVTRATP